MPRRCTTRTWRRKHSSSTCRAGDGEDGTLSVQDAASTSGRIEVAETRPRSDPARRTGVRSEAVRSGSAYPHWFYLPIAVVFVGIFVIPTAMAFFYSLTRWT